MKEYEFNGITIRDCSEIVKKYDGLCDKAKNLLMDWLISCSGLDMMYFFECEYIIEESLSPIEQIFNICFYRYVFESIYMGNDVNDIYLELGYHPSTLLYENFASQKEIIVNSKKYIADFCITFDRIKKLIPQLENLKYIIELDGFDYHSKKEQMNYDYEREQDLQLAGYKIMRFTGSQVYNKPFECVDKFVKLVVDDMRKEIKNGKKTN